MKITYKNVNLNLEIQRNNTSGNYILFLHGFTGSAKDWNEVIQSIDTRFNLACLDLIGHGESQSPADQKFYSAESIIDQIDDVINKLTNEKVILVGYSMGGRAALCYADRHQEKLKALILESSTPGISSESVRTERIASDEKLEKFILDNPIGKFVDYWINIDLFSSQKKLPQDKLKLVHRNKLKNNPVGLANSLKEFSTGKMPPLFEKLKDVRTKTLLISGELDEKFTAINSNLAKLFPSSEHKIIIGAGHNTHLEKPDEFIKVVNNFLKEF